MDFAAATSSLPDAADAINDVIEQVTCNVEAADVALVWVFASHHELSFWDELGQRLKAAFPRAVSMGCTAEGCIGDGRELERQPAISLQVAALPGVQLDPFHVSQEELDTVTWHGRLPDPELQPAFFVLGEPFSIDIRRVLSDLEASHPGRPVLGGMASAGFQPNQNRLLCDGVTYTEGLVGVSLTGAVDVQTVVSQGCRPIGSPYVVTQARGNVIKGLKNRPAMTTLEEMAASLPPEDQELLRHGVFVGRAIDEYQKGFKRGDFLIHGIIDVDRETGELKIAGNAKTGTTVQFHVRDAASADEDLREMLSSHEQGGFAGGLLFSCNGRGTRMWESPGHDVHAVANALGSIPVAGCFCAGEVGPVGGKNFVHGYTAVLALFRSA